MTGCRRTPRRSRSPSEPRTAGSRAARLARHHRRGEWAALTLDRAGANCLAPRQPPRESPGYYIHSVRLERAAQLLRHRAATVSEVAYAVGYRDAEHFSKQFGRAYGVTPSAYAE